MELKTLIDIEKEEIDKQHSTIPREFIIFIFKNLRQEAIKWIKDMQNNWHDLGNYGDGNYAPESMAFIKFFNIT